MDINLGHFFRLSTLRGAPIQVDSRQLTPIARSLTVGIQVPRVPAGVAWVWVRPKAVEISEGGSVQTIPIRNWTRIATAGIGLTVLIVARSLEGWQKNRRS